MTIQQTLTGPVAAELANAGIHLVLSGDDRTSGDAWCDATDIVRANAPGQRLALIHLNEGSWDGGVPRFLEHGKGWVDATLIKVSHPYALPSTARTIVEVLNRHGLNATWDGDPESCVHIHLTPADLKDRTPVRPTTADRLRSAYQYAETHATHGHDVMLDAAAELDQVTADRNALRRSLDELEGAVVARRADELDKVRVEATREALVDMHQHMLDLMMNGATVKDLAQEVDDWFVKKGLGTVIYH
jgi:hypothetical protein